MDRATGRDDGSVHQQAIPDQLRHSGVRPHAEYRGPLLRQVLEGVRREALFATSGFAVAR
jgi:hypothetical protein